jgi:hypothetical protein
MSTQKEQDWNDIYPVYDYDAEEEEADCIYCLINPSKPSSYYMCHQV